MQDENEWRSQIFGTLLRNWWLVWIRTISLSLPMPISVSASLSFSLPLSSSLPASLSTPLSLSPSLSLLYSLIPCLDVSLSLSHYASLSLRQSQAHHVCSLPILPSIQGTHQVPYPVVPIWNDFRQHTIPMVASVSYRRTAPSVPTTVKNTPHAAILPSLGISFILSISPSLYIPSGSTNCPVAFRKFWECSWDLWVAYSQSVSDS